MLVKLNICAQMPILSFGENFIDKESVLSDGDTEDQDYNPDKEQTELSECDFYSDSSGMDSTDDSM